MGRVVCFGEIMLRLSPPGYGRIVQADSFEATFGGGEANVAVALAGLGDAAAFVTRLPEGPLGQAALNALRRYGVDTSDIVRGGDRLGVYYLEKGASQRPSLVVYDRKDSSIATASRGAFDWPRILAGASWFHVTGITPALGDGPAALALEAARTARGLGIPVSCDLNYRKNLWSPERARAGMGALMAHVDVCVANEEDAEKVFGIRAGRTDADRGALDRDAYEGVAAALMDRFGLRAAAVTLRESRSASDNGWSGLLRTREGCWTSPRYEMHVVDRVGGGDAFAAGLIHGMLAGWAPERTVGFAAAASCLKHSIEGDFNHVSEKEVLDLLKTGGSGRVVR